MLKQRVITALILLPIMLGMLFWASGGLWAAFSGLIAILALWEYSRMCGIGDKERVPYLAGSALFMLLAACAAGFCRQSVVPGVSLLVDCHALVVEVQIGGWAVAGRRMPSVGC